MAYRRAISRELANLRNDGFLGEFPSEPDRADGFAGHAAIGSCDPRHGDGDLRARVGDGALYHLLHGLLRDGTEIDQRLAVDPEQIDLRLVGIGDKTAVEQAEEPLMRVIASAMPPPVQDSAVAIMSPRAFKAAPSFSASVVMSSFIN